jgi:hypothetical protein
MEATSMILVVFYWDCGRMGDVSGLFVCTQEQLDSAINKYVYLGEVLGKHSEICGILKPKNIKIISADKEKIQWLIDAVGCEMYENTYTISGYNPLNYIDEGYVDDE